MWPYVGLMNFDAVIGSRYHLIADLLRQRIVTGDYPAGSQLPSEQHLRVEYDCGRDTLRDALDVLRRECLIIKDRGRRATVAPLADRSVVSLNPGSTVTARMPTRPELPALGCRPEVPILEVTPPGGPTLRYPAHRVQLTIPHRTGCDPS
jgi:DNA-binding transcriptional MocR family regulator